MASPLHGEGPRFEPGRDHSFAVRSMVSLFPCVNLFLSYSAILSIFYSKTQALLIQYPMNGLILIVHKIEEFIKVCIIFHELEIRGRNCVLCIPIVNNIDL